jgi:transposase
VKVTDGSSKRVSLAALIAVKPGCRPRLIYRTHTGKRGDARKGFTETDYARFLDAAHQQLGGPLVVVWDNLNAHVSATMGKLAAARDWLTACRLPAYAHELNPVERVWSVLKRSLANLVKRNLGQLTALIRTRLRRMQYRPRLLEGFLVGTGLDLTPFGNSQYLKSLGPCRGGWCPQQDTDLIRFRLLLDLFEDNECPAPAGPRSCRALGVGQGVAKPAQRLCLLVAVVDLTAQFDRRLVVLDGSTVVPCRELSVTAAMMGPRLEEVLGDLMGEHERFLMMEERVTIVAKLMVSRAHLIKRVCLIPAIADVTVDVQRGLWAAVPGRMPGMPGLCAVACDLFRITGAIATETRNKSSGRRRAAGPGREDSPIPCGIPDQRS